MRSRKGLIYWLLTLAGILLATAPALATDPYEKENNTWINLSGTVKSVSANSFMLDYGKGEIRVEMDDGDRDADAYKLIEGDKVAVTGKVDADFFEKTSIEASHVYVEKIGSYFFASAADEEDAIVNLVTPLAISSVVVQGIVTSTDNDEFTLNTGLDTLTVEVDEMPYNPLDDEGYLKIEPGDRVRVTGTIDYDLFEGREIVATTAVKLIKN